jgi:hypothetical protein
MRLKRLKNATTLVSNPNEFEKFPLGAADFRPRNV